MTKATDRELGQLHKLLAASFLNALEAKDDAAALLAEHGDELPENVRDFLEKYTQPNPSLLTAATKFLKDNDITCAIEDSAELSALEQNLANKKKFSDNVVPFEEAL